MNMDFHGYERDFVWPDHGLVVEYDGWDGHKTRAQQEVDRSPATPPWPWSGSRFSGSPG